MIFTMEIVFILCICNICIYFKFERSQLLNTILIEKEV